MSETLTLAHGLHRNLPADEYHAADALNNSRLTWMARSPLYCKWREANPTEPTPEMLLGTALHAMLLEPAKFAAEFMVAPECDRRTKDGKATWAAFVEASAGMIVIDDDTMRKVVAMVAAVNTHPYARNILASRIETELSGFWRDEDTGLLCKFRADAIAKPKGVDFPTLVDIKTTRSIEPDEFARSMKTYGYFRQLPFYLMGLTECGLHCDTATIIAVETSEPYEVAVFVPSPDDLSLGRRSALALMKQYARCRADDRWPDRNNGKVSEVALSRWQREDIVTDLKLLEAQ